MYTSGGCIANHLSFDCSSSPFFFLFHIIMAMYGQKGRDLLLELKSSDWLPPYNDELVRASLEEIALHFDELQNQIDDKKPPMEARPSLLLHDMSIRRNKQCLLAYHVARLEQLKQEVNTGFQHFHSAHLQNVTAEAEVDFLQHYEKLRTNFGARMGLNLRESLFPPEQDFVQVRVLSSKLGTIVTESGSAVNLQLGTIHYLPRGDVEPLIRQGLLEQVDGEEEG
jgi:GINS complex subunit 1